MRLGRPFVGILDAFLSKKENIVQKEHIRIQRDKCALIPMASEKMPTITGKRMHSQSIRRVARMNILLTGATGYIARRLLPALVEAGHTVVCCVRNIQRFRYNGPHKERVTVVRGDFLDPKSLESIPDNIDVAYYLIHSMSSSSGDFSRMESESAQNFLRRIERTQAQQIIYLSGIVNDRHLSKHLQSRKHVETLLSSGTVPLTTLRAGIIIGSGSASFEIIRDLVEKLPVMITPRWLNTRCQPIAIRNVVQYLVGVALNPKTYSQSFDIGGPDILTFKEMLLQFAEVRHLKRYIYTLPLMTPRLSSYWLYFITSTNYRLAVNLVEGMKVEVVCAPSNIQQIVPMELLPYKEAVRLAFDKVEQNQVLSSWSDVRENKTLAEESVPLLTVPKQGCFVDIQKIVVQNPDLALENIFSVGGKHGWYYANFLWNLRGWIDKRCGGTGMAPRPKNVEELQPGQRVGLWRVLIADRAEKRLLLYAEMKLPGEAWLEFKLDGKTLTQTATYRPLGLWGRSYWYLMLPFHHFIFRGLAERIATRE